MNSVGFEITCVLVLILINGLLAMSEMAIVSSRKALLQSQANKGDRGAARALKLSEDPDKFLSTVQIGITSIGILSGVFGGAKIAEFLTNRLQEFRYLAESAEAISMVIVVFCITFLSLVLGELIPKRLGIEYPEAISRVVAGPLQIISSISRPLVSLLMFSTRSLLKLFGFAAENSDQANVTEEEIITMVQQGGKSGVFDSSEQNLIQRVIGFGDRKINSVMTPRPEIVWLDLDDNFEINKDKLKVARHSHFPIAKGNLDNIIGIMHVKDGLARSLEGNILDLTQDLRQPLFVPETADAKQLLELFRRSGIHIAVVVDEYGMVQGIVTLTDILHVLVGELPPIHTKESNQAIQREDGSWLVDGLISIPELRELISIPKLVGEESGNFHTLAGFVMTQLGRVPIPSDHFETKDLRFEVVDMDDNRIDKVLITFLQK